jgi:glycosyltransferase involved in cell wall biosynthesis
MLISKLALVLMPVYNEASCIESILKNVYEYFETGFDSLKENIHFLIVNDGSTDNTTYYLKENDNVSVIHLSKNNGIGYCINIGFEYAKNNNFHFLVLYPGNGRISLESLKNGILFSEDKKGSLLIGSRFLPKAQYENIPFYKLFLIKFFSSIVSIVNRISITDMTCGLRIIQMSDWDFCEKLVPDKSRYSAEQIICINSLNQGLNVAEFPIYLKYNNIIRPYSHFTYKSYSQVIKPWVEYNLWKMTKMTKIKPDWLKE